MTVVRFAPSPTGRLHVGNIRAALFNKLYALKAGGRFWLRLDDTDAGRSTKDFEAGILDDLAWLGIGHDAFARQSERSARYQAAAETLKAKGLLYPCYETPEELERRRKLQRARHQPPVYDRAALRLAEAEHAALKAEGRVPHWRFALSGARVAWTDRIRGPVEIDTASVSDPVLVRADGRFLYTLPSVVDDIAFAVTDVIRGEDHVANTGVQIEIFRALGAEPPAFAHYALLVGAGGGALSKRLGSLSIADLRAEGLEPMAVNALLAKLGTSDAVAPRFSLAELAAEFDLSHVGRAPAHFDPAELRALNAKLLHDTPFDAVAQRLAALGVGGGDAFWDAVRGNVGVLADARAWWDVVNAPLTPVLEDAPFAAQAADLLPEALDGDSWGAWTKALAAATGRKGRALFHPLRLALTARENGPEMKKLLPLIGSARAKARLRGETA